MTQPITYGYVEGGFVDPGYLVEEEGVRVKLIHPSATVRFARGPRYIEYAPKFYQPTERTASNLPVWFSPKFSTVPFTAEWPAMTDAELASLRTFMFQTVSPFDAFVLNDVGNDMSFPVRFAKRRLAVKHQTTGYNHVTVELVRI